MPRSPIQASCLLLLSLIVLSFPAAAKEWFVSPTGDDKTGDGSQARPFRSIMRVLNTSTGVARRGDTITLRGPAGNNTYTECDVRLRVPLTLRSPPGERAHIHCPIRTRDSVVVQIDPGASGSRLSNLEISGGQYYGVMMQTDWYQGGPDSDTGASDIVLEDLLIHHTGRDGIKITPKSRRITIRRSQIHDTGQAYPPGTPAERKNADGIDNVNGDGMVVEDSYIHDIATTGLYFKGGAADVVIQRNRIENTGDAGILAGFDTSPEFFDLAVNPGYYESVRGIIRNNVVRNTGYAGIGLFAAKDALVANNTIVNAARKGHAAIYFGLTFQDWDESAGRPASVNPRIVNNLVMQNNGRCVDIRWSHELGGMSALDGAAGLDWNGYGNSSGPCRFGDQRPASAPGLWINLDDWRHGSGGDANSVAARFELDAQGRPVAGSPAIGAGTQVADVADDIQRHARTPPFDLGAFQSNGTPAAIDTAAPQPAAAPRDEEVPMLGTTPDNVSLFVKLVPDPMTLLPWIALAVFVAVLLVGLAVAAHLIRKRNVMGWLMGYLRGGWKAPVPPGTTRHLMFCFVDHYEPAWGKPDYAKECERVARWRRDLPTLCEPHRDADGRPPVHSFFYPEEEYRPEHLDALVDLCRMGLGEIEIHLHHDGDTEAGLREKLSRFTELLASRHDALPRDPQTGQPRWTFIHGNWALDNCHPSGRHCGVDNELIVLREEGCYADFTLPAAPDPCQTSTVNRIYYAKDDPHRGKSHDQGERVRVGGQHDAAAKEADLMIIQGPLGFRWNSRKFGIIPRIENSDIRAVAPPSPDRIDAWVETGIHVEGRPEWIFVKIHTHGAEDCDMDTLLGKSMDQAYRYLASRYNDGKDWKLHYVSARETYNIIKAAEAGMDDDPGKYRDFVIPRPLYRVPD